MVVVSVKSNVDQVLSKLRNYRADQIPFATAKALTDTAGDVQNDLRQAMPRSFDRPTPFTLNSLFRTSATKRRLVATVGLKDDAGKGTPAGKYLRPQIHGGARRNKRFEAALVRIGAMASGYYAVPALGARIDPYGNVERAQIVQVLSALRAFGQQGYQANRTKRSVKRLGTSAPEFFVSRGDRGLPIGIWQRFKDAGGYVKPVFLFVQAPVYEQRYDFFGIAAQKVAQAFPQRFEEAIKLATATAR